MATCEAGWPAEDLQHKSFGKTGLWTGVGARLIGAGARSGHRAEACDHPATHEIVVDGKTVQVCAFHYFHHLEHPDEQLRRTETATTDQS